MRGNIVITNFKLLILFAVFTVLGLYFIPKLTVRLNPTNKNAIVYVSYALQGASPEIIDQKVGSLIEEKISLLNGIKKIQSYAYSNSGYLSIFLDKYADIDKTRLEIATAVRQIKTALPPATSYPQVSLRNPNDESNSAFLIYQINANKQPYEIKKYVDQYLLPQLSVLTQVDKVVINGYRPIEYLISFDESQLQLYHISSNEIIEATQNYFDKMSLGKIFFNGKYISASIKNTAFIDWHIPLAKNNDIIIYLDQITQIRKQEQPAQSYFRINGKNTLSLSVFPTNTANTLNLKKQVESIIAQQEKYLPDNFSITKTYDSTDYLQTELHKIYNRSFWVVVILLLFVLIVSRSIKYFVIIIISLVANLSIAFLFYYLFGIQIQLYSLAGITISFGLMIDNSIVMIDHLRRYRNIKVFLPILASTLTTIGALFVIFFLKEQMKNNLIDFAYVIIINLFVSLLVALFLIPALVDKLNFSISKKSLPQSVVSEFFQRIYEKILWIMLRYKKLMIVLAILLFGLPVFMLPQKMSGDNILSKTYNKTLGNYWYLDNVRPYVDKYLGGSLRLFSQYVFESATYRSNEETKLYAIAQMQKGYNMDQMNEVFLLLDNYLSQFDQIKTFKTSVYNTGYAEVEITFKKQSSSFSYQLKANLIRKALDWGGIHWNIYGIGKGFNNGTFAHGQYNFQIESVGYNNAHLNRWVDTLKLSLLQHPRINKIKVSASQYPRKTATNYYQIDLSNKLLALHQVSSINVKNKVQNLSISSSPSINISADNHLFPVRLQSKQAISFDIWQLLHYPINVNRTFLKLNDISQITTKKSPAKIYKENQEYIEYINVQYTGANKFGKKVIQRKIDSLQNKLPLGIRFKLKESNYSFSQDSQHYYYLLFFIIVLIWGISAVFFESIKQSFIVISLIPISFIGIFLTFYLFDYNFDQGGIAGFILISGITVNAVYYILNDYNYLKKTKLDKSNMQLYLQAFNNKVFPISLTIISTILGFIPFVINGQNEVFWFALAVATIGGLFFSFFGILIYLPIFILNKQEIS